MNKVHFAVLVALSAFSINCCYGMEEVDSPKAKNTFSLSKQYPELKRFSCETDNFSIRDFADRDFTLNTLKSVFGGADKKFLKNKIKQSLNLCFGVFKKDSGLCIGTASLFSGKYIKNALGSAIYVMEVEKGKGYELEIRKGLNSALKTFINRHAEWNIHYLEVFFKFGTEVGVESESGLLPYAVSSQFTAEGVTSSNVLPALMDKISVPFGLNLYYCPLCADVGDLVESAQIQGNPSNSCWCFFCW